MYVEVWQHFKQVLGDVQGALSPTHKQICGVVINWANAQGNNYFGVSESEISEATQWINSIINQFSGVSKNDLIYCVTFLNRLNRTIPAYNYNSTYGCTEHGYYWYDGACHAEAKPKPEPEPEPEPEPQPEPLPPKPMPPKPEPLPIPPIPPGLEGLLAQVEEFYKTIPVTQPIRKGIVLLARNWLRAIVAFQKFTAK